MKKIIANSKILFHTVLTFIFNVNVIYAQETSEWGTNKLPVEVPFDILSFAYEYIEQTSKWLSFILFAILIFISFKYILSSIKKEEQKKKRFKKILFQSFFLCLFFTIIYIFIVLISGPCCLV